MPLDTTEAAQVIEDEGWTDIAAEVRDGTSTVEAALDALYNLCEREEFARIERAINYR